MSAHDHAAAHVASFLPLTLENVRREYPNGILHTMPDAEHLADEPHHLHPSFYGCYDWHSAVHGARPVHVLRKRRNLHSRKFMNASATYKKRGQMETETGCGWHTQIFGHILATIYC